MKMIDRKYIKNIIAGVLVAGMAFIDVSLAGHISFCADSIETEEYSLEEYLADGNYDGNDSDSESADEQIVELSAGKQFFNILEILPTEKKASIGYTIGGCEPFEDAHGITSGQEYVVTPQQMREAYMDAVFNKEPGSDGADDNNNLNNFPLAHRFYQGLQGAFNDGGAAPFKFDAGTHSGYYKYVGGNKGVYALKKDSNGNIAKDGRGNPIFRSKFYFGSGNYDYIFVKDKTSTNTGVDYNVTNQKRINYTNNEKFLKEAYGLADDAAVTAWKEDHVVEVTTRTPVSVSYDDIERADIIILNNATSATMRYYTDALKINNYIHNQLYPNDQVNEEKDSNLTFSDVDFDNFEKVIRIYERVAVREDAAFIGSVTNVRGGTGETTIDSNVKKLMCMLFYVYKVSDKNESDNDTGAPRAGSGRDLFMNLIKRYASDPGEFVRVNGETALKYINLQKDHEKYKNDPDVNVRNGHPDYRAPMLRHSDYYDSNGNVKIPYSHYYKFGPGHPLVESADQAITGGHFDENGMLIPEHDQSKVQTRDMRRKTRTMYDLGGLSDKVREVYDSDGFKYHVNMYQSMSNTTDYIYIDSDGNLVRSGKYAGYWFNMDDDGAGQHQYKRIMWDEEEKSTWPWDGSTDNAGNLNVFKYWFFHESTTKSDSEGRWEKGDLHLWFDLFDYENVFGIKNQYRALNGVSPNDKFRNSAIEGENGLFKNQFMKSVIDKRKYKREIHDPEHVIATKEDYYISMNILNGDGVNEKAAKKNKTLYYNAYEESAIRAKQTDANETGIPIRIRVRSSDHINSINIYNRIKEGANYTDKLLVTYSFDADPANSALERNGSVTGYFTGKATHAKARKLKLTPNNELDPASNLPKLLTSSSKKPIYTYEGTIYAELSDLYLEKHNTKFVVELTAEKPGGDTGNSSDDAVIQDEIMIVRRDFFALD